MGDDFRVEFPTGSGNEVRLRDVAEDIARRLVSIWLDDENGRRPVFGKYEKFQTDPDWHDLLWFHEYFHGDTGAGIGASHQTGWTGIVAHLLCRGGLIDTIESGRSTARMGLEPTQAAATPPAPAKAPATKAQRPGPWTPRRFRASSSR